MSPRRTHRSRHDAEGPAHLHGSAPQESVGSRPDGSSGRARHEPLRFGSSSDGGACRALSVTGVVRGARPRQRALPRPSAGTTPATVPRERSPACVRLRRNRVGVMPRTAAAVDVRNHTAPFCGGRGRVASRSRRRSARTRRCAAHSSPTARADRMMAGVLSTPGCRLTSRPSRPMVATVVLEQPRGPRPARRWSIPGRGPA